MPAKFAPYVIDTDGPEPDDFAKEINDGPHSNMTRLFATISMLALLTACDSPQPFTFGGSDETEETVDETDPNVIADSKFAFDASRGLTMNSVEFDAANNELIINNLPFDGPAGRYINPRSFGGGEIFESIQTPTTGLVKHYAVFIRSDHIQATAAAGVDWGDYGYGGANITRDGFTLPDGGEYVFVGEYVGVRTFEERSGLEFVSGDVVVILDILDFDPVEGIQGAITGTIGNRHVETPEGRVIYGTTPVSLEVVSFTTEEGVFDGGVASSNYADGSNGAMSGTYEGFLAGDDASEIGANVVLQGAAYSQNVQYEIVTYTVTTPAQQVVNPFTGVVTTVPESITEGEVSAMTSDARSNVQDDVDNGIFVPTLTVGASDLPADAVVVGTQIENELVISEDNVREIGVVVAAQ